ncbi:unnamed protein product [Rhodiola kirilowii]
MAPTHLKKLRNRDEIIGEFEAIRKKNGKSRMVARKRSKMIKNRKLGHSCCRCKKHKKETHASTHRRSSSRQSEIKKMVTKQLIWLLL